MNKAELIDAIAKDAKLSKASAKSAIEALTGAATKALKKGDKVFIINGNYDNDLLIKENKYKKGRDGYKILYIDKCRVVLDIDFTGVLPYCVENDDDFIKVYSPEFNLVIKNEKDLIKFYSYWEGVFKNNAEIYLNKSELIIDEIIRDIKPYNESKLSTQHLVFDNIWLELFNYHLRKFNKE
jgi:hypothetical protein